MIFVKAKDFKNALKNEFVERVKKKEDKISYSDWRDFMLLPDECDILIQEYLTAHDFIVYMTYSQKNSQKEKEFTQKKNPCFVNWLNRKYFSSSTEGKESTMNDSAFNNAAQTLSFAVDNAKIQWDKLTNTTDACQDAFSIHSTVDGPIVATVSPDDFSKWVTIDRSTSDYWGTVISDNKTTTWATTNPNITFIEDSYCKKSECPLNKKEKKEDMNITKNFDFGPCTNDNVRMSMYGLAVKNTAGSWVSYNKDSKQIIDVDVLNFDGRQFLFKMPVAIDKIAVGDIVIHHRVPMFVTEVVDGNITAVDAVAGEVKHIIPTTNMFGFNFVTKVVSLMDVYSQAPTADQPFGNLLPLLMLNDKGDMDTATMLMLFSMNGGMKFDTSNPMLMYLLLKDGNGKDLLPFLLMSQKN